MQLELLAPAKNKDIGIAAIDCGADALYIAGPAFGAREAASNTFEEIKELIRYAHRFNVKVYLVINTIIYDSELEEAQNHIIQGYKIGCDAIIIQDLGILNMELPPIDLYASTQTNIRTPEQAKFLKSLGFKRLILARELSLKQIKEIREATLDNCINKGESNSSCELETFVHGALCVSYSGQCYLSCHLSGRSANRGCCIQACRSKYDLIDSTGRILKKDAPLLSLKDFSLEKHISELVDAGVSSFKIEGRLKNISYVRNITKHYRETIDRLGYSKSSYGRIEGGFSPNIEQTFNRGYTTYFLSGKRGKWNSGESAKSKGETIGEISIVQHISKFESRFTYRGKELSNGDGILIITPKGESIGTRVDKVENGLVSIKNDVRVVRGSKIYRNFNIKFEAEVENNPPKRFLEVTVTICASPTKVEVYGECEDGTKVQYCLSSGEEGPFQAASNRELILQSFKKQIEKNSGIFKFKLVNIIGTDKFVPFISISSINSIRRELASLLGKEFDKKEEAFLISRNERLKEMAKRDLKGVIPPMQTTKLNCSNHLSKELYSSIGIHTNNAFELDMDNSDEYAELMRTKYCLRYELGLCGRKISEPWYLVNNGKRLQLKFDCKKCEMVVL